MRHLRVYGKGRLIYRSYYWTDVYKKAIALGDKYYIDPKTGYTVFTEIEHLTRGYCCHSKCRHSSFVQYIQ
ncbi:unnamed protein product [Schistosoma guineensis]|nr:unnamed protein product [Schistosoma guineensis]